MVTVHCHVGCEGTARQAVKPYLGVSTTVPLKLGESTPLRPNDGEHASLGRESSGLSSSVLLLNNE